MSSPSSAPGDNQPAPLAATQRRRLRLEEERDRILRALEAERWIVARAGRGLGVPRHWLRFRIRKYELEPPNPEGAGT